MPQKSIYNWFFFGVIYNSEICEVIQVAINRGLVYIYKMKHLVLAKKNEVNPYVLTLKGMQDILSDKKETV